LAQASYEDAKNDGVSHRNGVVSFFLPKIVSFPTSARALVESEPARWSILSSGEKTIDLWEALYSRKYSENTIPEAERTW
jgi:hypothetical protein